MWRRTRATMCAARALLISWCILRSASASAAAAPSSERSSTDDDSAAASGASPRPELLADLADRLRSRAASSILRWEIFTMACGHHLVSAADDGRLDGELHRAALATAALWTRLATMERVDAAIENATVETARLAPPNLLDQKVAGEVLARIERRLRLDEAPLYRRYAQLKNGPAVAGGGGGGGHKFFLGAEQYLGDRQHRDAIADWMNEPALKRYFVNKLFLQRCGARRASPSSSLGERRRRPPPADEHRYFAAAAALVRLAQSGGVWSSTVQRIYDETLDEVAADFSPLRHPYESNSRFFDDHDRESVVDETTPKLFDKLADKCRTYPQPELYRDFQSMKKKIDEEESAAYRQSAVNLFPL